MNREAAEMRRLFGVQVQLVKQALQVRAVVEKAPARGKRRAICEIDRQYPPSIDYRCLDDADLDAG